MIRRLWTLSGLDALAGSHSGATVRCNFWRGVTTGLIFIKKTSDPVSPHDIVSVECGTMERSRRRNAQFGSRIMMSL